jgi:hypothetical protein
MFFHLQLERNITLEPRHFGARMREVLEEKLKHEVSWGVIATRDDGGCGRARGCEGGCSNARLGVETQP